MKSNAIVAIASEFIMHKIYVIREEKIMLDRDLAELYQIETKYLKRQVKRNIDRFPDDFMFELTEKEFENWRRQFGTSNSADKKGLRYAPYAFTEYGILMLSSVLNSAKAIQINIQIMRIFSQVRKMLVDNTELRLAIEKLENRSDKHDRSIELLFNQMHEIDTIREKTETPRKKMGYKINQ
jgi:hypothetical protein